MATYAPRRTVYIGSMSKLLVPGLRIGYIAGAPDVIRLLANETVVIDRQGNVPTELAVAELIQSGELHRHARKALQVYLGRRNAFAQLLAESFGDAAHFKVPAGGLSFWITFRDSSVLDAIENGAPNANVRFLPSRSFATAPCEQRGASPRLCEPQCRRSAEAVRRLHQAAGSAVRAKGARQLVMP